MEPYDNPPFPRDPSDGGPFRDQRPPRIDPDFPDPNPHQPQRQFPQPQHHDTGQRRAFPSPFGPNDGTECMPTHKHPQHAQPPQPPRDGPPPSGYRIALNTNAQFPPEQAREPPFKDSDGVTPVFVGSAIFDDSVHPCKIVPSMKPPCRVPYGGTEREHNGRYDLLPITADMEWVQTRDGRIPQGRRLVEGGYESGGAKLYHALADIDGVQVPGKTGLHLGGANIPFGGNEHIVREYKILCWR